MTSIRLPNEIENNLDNIIDAGSLIALFDKNDKNHIKILNFIREFKGKLFTSWSVITEASHFLKFNISVQIDFYNWLYKAINIIELNNNDFARIIELTKKYSDLPMDLADCTLILISEKLKIKNIITLDSDYYIYRTKNKKILKYLL